MNAIDTIHGGYVHPRRVQVLARRVAGLLPQGAHVLDVGCGDGQVSERVLELRPDVTISGIDVLVRPSARITVTAFDGMSIPHTEGTFDAVMLIDVLHHMDDPLHLLREAARVARHHLVIKDHVLHGWLARSTLRLMDRVGNARHGVALPHNYWTREQWASAFQQLRLTTSDWTGSLRLYPEPADWVFGRQLHFLARVDVPEPLADVVS